MTGDRRDCMGTLLGTPREWPMKSAMVQRPAFCPTRRGEVRCHGVSALVARPIQHANRRLHEAPSDWTGTKRHVDDRSEPSRRIVSVYRTRQISLSSTILISSPPRTFAGGSGPWAASRLVSVARIYVSSAVPAPQLCQCTRAKTSDRVYSAVSSATWSPASGRDG